MIATRTETAPASAPTREPAARQAQLDRWLAQGRKLWSVRTPNGDTIEAWIVARGIAIVQLYARGGWELYTAIDKLDIGECLNDAAARLGALTPADLAEIEGES